MPDSLSQAAANATPANTQAPQTVDGGQAEPSPQDGTQGDANEIKAYEKRLADTQNALKQAQAEFHQMKGQVAQMNTQLNSQRQAEENTDILQSDEFLKRFDDDPAKGLQEAIGFERERLSKAFVEIMDQRDKEMREHFSKQLTVAPEKQALSSELSELGQTMDGFSNLPEEMQISFAKKLRSAKGVESLPPPGNPAGTGMSAAQRQSAEDAHKKRIKELTYQMFGGEQVAGSEQFPSIAGIGSMFKPTGS